MSDARRRSARRPLVPPGPELVRTGRMAVRSRAEAPRGLAIRGLGSCVALFVYDQDAGLGGLAHVLLPEPRRSATPAAPAAFAATAVDLLVETIVSRGGRRAALRAKIAGGAQVFPPAAEGRETLGARNVRATVAALRQRRVAIEAMDVGGGAARAVVADIASARLHVTRQGRRARIL